MLSRVKRLDFPSKPPKRRALMKGSAGEQIYSAHLKAEHSLYCGVSSFNRTTLSGGAMQSADHPLINIASAILRMVYKKEFGANVTSWDDQLGFLVPPLAYGSPVVYDNGSQLRRLVFYSRQQLQQGQNLPTGTGNVGRITIYPCFTLDMSGLTTQFNNKAHELAVLLQHWFCKKFTYQGSTAVENENFYRELYGYAAEIVEGITDVPLTRTRQIRTTPIRRLDNRNLKLRVDTKVTLAPSGALDNNDIKNLTTYVHQNSYIGKMYYFKDPYPVLDLDQRTSFVPADSTSYDNTDQAGSFKRLVMDTNGDGIIRLDEGVTNAETLSWSRIRYFPEDHKFKNLSRVGHFMCENGGTRTIDLVFDFYGPINKFFKGYLFIDQSNLSNAQNYPEVVGEMHGTCMLFALREHNPESYGTTGEPIADPIFCGLTVKRKTFAMLGKEKKQGMDVTRWEPLSGMIETNIAKDVFPVNA